MNDIDIDELRRSADDVCSYWSEIYEKSRRDLEFLSDDPAAQWPEGSYQARLSSGRPVLTIDQCSQFINQVANDVRMNTPSINIIPHGGGADLETAEVFQGLIREIEANSSADDAYDNAVAFGIKCGIGFIRVDHDYENGLGFEQVLRVNRVINPFSVYIDPFSVQPDGSDAEFGYVFDTMPVERFKAEFPKAEAVSFSSQKSQSQSHSEEMVTICEYFKVHDEFLEVSWLPDGTMMPGFVDGSVHRRKIRKRRVYRYKVSGEDILEKSVFPGAYIPLVPVYGEEAWIDGKRNLYSLIRRTAPAQQMYNYWKSLEMELLSQQPRAVWIAPEGVTEDYGADYLNSDKAGVLRYKAFDASGNAQNPPQRIDPPRLPTGITQASQFAIDDIKATMGLYNAYLGQKSNETSGVAIRERKQEGDRAVFHFGDNLLRSVEHVGRILVSAVPDVYDTPREVFILGKEDEAHAIGINGARVEGQERDFFLSDGVYNVRVTTGKQFSTLREEAGTFLQEVLSTSPDMMQIFGDIFFKTLDMPGSQAIGERMKRFIAKSNPGLIEEEDVDPQVQELQAALEQMQAALEQMQAELQSKDDELKLESERLQMENKLKAAELLLKERELALKEELARRGASAGNGSE